MEKPSSETELEQQYKLSHLRADLNFLPDWANRSAAFRRDNLGRLDVAYGRGDRDRLDFFPAAEAAIGPTVVFIHGGYWQRGDKSTYSFLAESFLKSGISFAAVNYDFCPSIRIAEIVVQVRRAMTWLWENIEDMGGNRHRLYVAGHSAGAHLGGMMMTTDWSSIATRAPRGIFNGAVLVSGIFDLEPLMSTSHKEALRLDHAEAITESVTNRLPVVDVPQLIACGVDESREFNRQSDLYVEKFASDTRHVERLAVLRRHHFDVIDEFAMPDSELFRKALDLVTAESVISRR